MILFVLKIAGCGLEDFHKGLRAYSSVVFVAKTSIVLASIDEIVNTIIVLIV